VRRAQIAAVSAQSVTSGGVGNADNLSAEDSQLLTMVFKMFDTDNDGVIDIDELEAVLRNLGFRPSVLEVSAIMKEASVADHTTIPLRGFLNMMARIETEEKEQQQLEEEKKKVEDKKRKAKARAKKIAKAENNDIESTDEEGMDTEEVYSSSSEEEDEKDSDFKLTTTSSKKQAPKKKTTKRKSTKKGKSEKLKQVPKKARTTKKKSSTEKTSCSPKRKQPNQITQIQFYSEIRKRPFHF